MDRREFLRGCIVGMSLAAHTPAPAHTRDADPRVLLVDATGARLGTSTLRPHEPYCFFYPYVSTPCLLLDMGARVRPVEAAPDDWRPGGVGPGGSVVAYTAICPHQWSHPEPEFSPIYYVAPGEPALLLGGRDRLIVCCAHASVFDPTAGGRVVQSPARFPLASIVLEWDEPTDALFAAGVRGPDSFDRFFAAFDRDRRLVVGSARVIPLAAYSRVVARC